MTNSALAGHPPVPEVVGIPEAGTAPRLRITVDVTSKFSDVAGVWGRLMRNATPESPGQSLGFIELWADTLKIPQRDRVFVTAMVDGYATVLLPLWRRKVGPLRMLTWFPGKHVGCNAPIADMTRLTAMTPAQRRALWSAIAARVHGADLIYLPAIPHTEGSLFAEIGQSMDSDMLYRAEFTNWATADSFRTKSRRKHDRQQGEKLDALGTVNFAELSNNDDTVPVIATMFRQRAARFAVMGVADPFASSEVRRFYSDAAGPTSAVDVRLHVLRLNGEIAAVRYNVISGGRMFCLISSMSDDPAIQGGSPGKQCLLRVMKTIYDVGYHSFDMGAGSTDEKRHWCNVEIPVRHHYLPLNATGSAVVFAHMTLKTMRRKIKANPALLGIAKRLRALMQKSKSAHE